MIVHYVGNATELDKDGNAIGTWIPGEWLGEKVIVLDLEPPVKVAEA
jgi:hypothetical protein